MARQEVVTEVPRKGRPAAVATALRRGRLVAVGLAGEATTAGRRPMASDLRVVASLPPAARCCLARAAR